jgi:hypothetical protein
LNPTGQLLAVTGNKSDVRILSTETDSFGDELSKMEGRGKFATAIAWVSAFTFRYLMLLISLIR